MIIEEFESLKTVLSGGRGFAQYYMWSDGNPSQEDRTGYFVTFVDGTDCIKICDNADEDVIGVVVSADRVGFVGGQSNDVEINGYKYGLVCLIGHALVRRVNSVQLGDYVIPNVLGMAQPSNFSTKVATPYFQSITITNETTYQLAHLPQENTLDVYLLTESGALEDAEAITIGTMAVGKIISVDGTSVEVVVGDTGFNIGDKLFFIYKYESPRNLGYKVTALFYSAGVDYAQINLVPNGNALAWIEENIHTLLNRIIANEGNVTVAINRANDAYALAESGGGEANVEIINRLNKIEDDMQQMQDVADSIIDDAVLKAEEVASGAVAKAETLAYEAKADAENANKEITAMTQTISDMKKITDPIDAWENADGSVGVEYLLEYIDNDLATKVEVQAVEGNLESAYTAIAQNAKEIQLTASSVQKYCVGAHSQAYGLTLDEAKSILPVGVVYAPTTDHTEEYETDENYSTQAFNQGFSYVWRGIAWEESSIENVNFSDIYVNPPAGESVSYWCTGNASLVNEDVTYEANTLYRGSQGQWIEVASAQDSSASRIASEARVTANEIALEVMGSEGYAGLKARVEGAEASIESITNLETDKTSALALLKQQVTDNVANISQLTEFTYTVAIDSKKLSEVPDDGRYYATQPEWSDKTNQWVFSGGTQSTPGFYDGVEYCYAVNSNNKQTYLQYICDKNNQWYVLEKGLNKSLAAIQQTANANGAAVAVVVENGKVKAAPIVASINNSGETNVKLNADKINFEGQEFTVSAKNVDFTAEDYTIGADKIAFTTEDYQMIADNIEIEADDIDLTGYVTVEDLKGMSTTIIDGSNITTGVIKSANYKADTSGSCLDLKNGSFDSKHFKLDSQGKMTAAEGVFSGVLQAAAGTFVGSLIAATGSFAGSISVNNGTFVVDADGRVTATSGTIGGVLIENIADKTSIPSTENMKDITRTVITNETIEAPNLTAGVAKVTNSLTVMDGDNPLLQAGDGSVNIGGWHVNTSSLYQDDICLYSKDQDTASIIGDSGELNTWRIKAGSNFGVTSNGTMFAKNANITGKISATLGQIGDWYIHNGYLTNSSDGMVHAGDVFLSPRGVNFGSTTGAYSGFIAWADMASPTLSRVAGVVPYTSKVLAMVDVTTTEGIKQAQLTFQNGILTGYTVI